MDSAGCQNDIALNTDKGVTSTVQALPKRVGNGAGPLFLKIYLIAA